MPISCIQNLRQMRNNIDATLTKLDFNSTRDITDSSLVTARPTVTPLKPSLSVADSKRRHSISIAPSLSRRPLTPATHTTVMSRVGSIRRPTVLATADSKRQPLAGGAPMRTPPLLNKRTDLHIDTPMPDAVVPTTASGSRTNVVPATRIIKTAPTRSAVSVNPPSRERIASLTKLASISAKATTKQTVAPKEPVAGKPISKATSLTKLATSSKVVVAVKSTVPNAAKP